MRRTLLTLISAICFLVFAQSALAGGGSYTFAGGTAKEQATVHSALEASSFSWSLIPRTITIHIGHVGDSYSTYGDIYLDSSLLDSGRFAWGVVQHEMGHQVDFFLLDDAKRMQMQQLLGGSDWCYSVSGLQHSDYGCERFASELAWAYWQSPDNSMKPNGPKDEAGAIPAAEFRAVLTQMIGAPVVPQAALSTKAFAPTAVAFKSAAPAAKAAAAKSKPQPAAKTPRKR
ncbi:MAG: hypothetical protein QOH95_2818 [Gaiellaceae bacterium]|jgi:hypothetical protein|nr:hypothetical protein [Gaiellaceae bacterium]